MVPITRKNSLDYAYRYAEDIKSGAIPACKWVKLAVDRFYKDLAEGPSRGIYFHEDEANIRFEVFDHMRIKKTYTTKGRGGKDIQRNQYAPFQLEPWQSFICANYYGFYEQDVRRFTTSNVCVARKNGKTTFAAGEGIVGGFFDGELESQVYCVANKKDQARILFKEAKKIINISPNIRELFDKENLTKDSIYEPNTDSTFQPLSSDANTLDGLNPHEALLDEAHEYKTSELYDVMLSGMGNRLNPRIGIYTTAGFHKDYWYYLFLMECLKILEGTIVDDSIFVLYYTLDSEDEIHNPEMWIKANPNLGVSVQKKFISREVQSMINIPSKRVGVLTKTFNLFTDSAETWIESETWQGLYRSQQWFETQTVVAAFGGLDFASSKDIYAITWFYVLESGDFYLSHRFYTPGQTIGNRYTGPNAQQYGIWEAQGHLYTTPGNTIDSTFCETYIIDTITQNNVTFTGYDPYKGTDIVKRISETIGTENVFNAEKNKLEEVSRLQPVKQTIIHLADATWKFEELIYDGKLFHDGNPVMSWMLSNVEIIRDTTGNVKPDRKNPNKKIDGVYSSLDAIKMYLTFYQEEEDLLSKFLPR